MNELVAGRRIDAARHNMRVRHGFTVVELLVTIAIMSLLMGIVIPSILKARASSKRLACGMHLREIGAATFFYLQSEKFFPPLNNMPADGHWQYNYLIWDGRDYGQNFGPLVEKGLFPEIQLLFCPVQESPFHQYGTFVNPWPPQRGVRLDTRAAYGRRALVTGLDVTRLPAGTALYADLFHTPLYIQSAHKSGINVAYIDGHVSWVANTRLLADNNMTLPTSLIDNPIMMDIWKELDTK